MKRTYCFDCRHCIFGKRRAAFRLYFCRNFRQGYPRRTSFVVEEPRYGLPQNSVRYFSGGRYPFVAVVNSVEDNPTDVWIVRTLRASPL